MFQNLFPATSLIALALSSTAPSADTVLRPETVMKAFGAQGEDSFSPSQIADFAAVFSRMDQDRDRFLTESEYASSSRHFQGNPSGVRGFIRASDNDGDGRLSQSEYVQNRIITDEAKAIFVAIDPTTDWNAVPAFRWAMPRSAFVESDQFSDRRVAETIFGAMDQDQDGVLQLPEYLVTYGQWARAGLPGEKLDGAF